MYNYLPLLGLFISVFLLIAVIIRSKGKPKSKIILVSIIGFLAMLLMNYSLSLVIKQAGMIGLLLLIISIAIFYMLIIYLKKRGNN